MPPPLYDERILAMLQSTSGSREAPQDSNGWLSVSTHLFIVYYVWDVTFSAERPPAYSIAGLSPPNVLRTPVSRNNSAAIQAAAPPIQGLPNQVDDDKDISEEFPRRIGRSRISSADAAFVNFPVPSTPNLDPKLGQSNLTQSTSSLATVATNVDIESGRRDHKRRENRNATGEREKEDSDSTNKNNTDPRMTLTQALSDGDVNAVSNDNRKPHSRIATPPLSIAMFVPKLQRRLSFSIEATESPAAEARGFGRVKSANVRPRANRPAQICQLNALDLAKLV